MRRRWSSRWTTGASHTCSTHRWHRSWWWCWTGSAVGRSGPAAAWAAAGIETRHMNDGRTPAWRAAGFCQPPAPPRLSIKRKGPLAGPDEENDMRLLIASLLALAMMPAMADFSFRFGDSVVTTGDSPGTIVRTAGRHPDRIVQLANRHGAAVGERWEYYLDNKIGRAHV